MNMRISSQKWCSLLQPAFALAVSCFGIHALQAQTLDSMALQDEQDAYSARSDHACRQVVLFGGFEGAIDNDVAETWIWDGNNWQQKFPAVSPSAREVGASMAFDTVHNEVVLFGGADLRSDLADTWVWNGRNWEEKVSSTSPPARAFDSIVYDRAHREVLLFGGQSQTPLSDTWVWDGKDWKEKFPMNIPPARSGHWMVYDSARHEVLLFGGIVNGAHTSSYLSDTWVWNGNDWEQRFPQTSPSARGGYTMAYDARRREVVLFGGIGAHGQVSDTWVWDGSNWEQRFPQTTPPFPACNRWCTTRPTMKSFYLATIITAKAMSRRLWFGMVAIGSSDLHRPAHHPGLIPEWRMPRFATGLVAARDNSEPRGRLKVYSVPDGRCGGARAK